MLFGTGYVLWVELFVQRRLCPIFVNSFGLLDIHEYSAGQRVVNGPPALGCHIIDCERRRVTAYTQDDTRVVFQGDKHDIFARIVYESRCQGQLAS